MRRIAIMALGVLLLLVAAAPASAGSYSKLRHRAHVLHSKVEKQIGDRAAGRDISTEGYRTKRGKVRKATGAELREFAGALDRMLNPPAPPPAPVAAPVTEGPSTVNAPSVPTQSSGPSSGGFCGGYQFDAQTWQAAGGSGTACGASPQEQDQRALSWWRSHGSAPWPHCGHLFPNLAAVRQCENSGRY